MDGISATVATAVLTRSTSDATGTLQGQMQNQALAHDNKCDLITILLAVIVEDMKSHAYQYTLQNIREMLSTFVDVYLAGLY